MDQLTIRGIDASLDEWLKQEAKRRGQSVNRYVLTLLQEASGATKPGKPTEIIHHELDYLAGSWSAEALQEFLEQAAPARTIDEALWR